MAKVTIDGKEYDTDTFNEHQNKAYAEAVDAGQEIKRLRYMMWLLEGRQNDLAKEIVKNAEETTEA